MQRRFASRFFLFAVATVLVAPLRAQDNSIDARLQAEIDRLAADLANGPTRELPPDSSNQTPPPSITAAGEDFVKAWQLWRRITFPPRPPEPTAPATPAADQVNVHDNQAEFEKLLVRTLEADPPPAPDEYDRFTYICRDLCTDGPVPFFSRRNQGLAILLLRKGETFAALRFLDGSPGPALNNLLKIYGTDPAELALSKWLNRRCHSAELCRIGGDKTATMLLRWSRLQWEAEVARMKSAPNPATNIPSAKAEPTFPGADLLLLLRPGNGVSDDTKAAIAQLIETQGTTLLPLAHWLKLAPQGAEKWLVALARTGLTDDLNQTRTMSDRILTAAGIPHDPPQLRPPPKFRVRINGKPWPGEAGMQLKPPVLDLGPVDGFGPPPALTLVERDTFTADPDLFLVRKPPAKFELRACPEPGVQPSSPLAPWLRATVPFPPNPSGMTAVDFATIKLTIQPVLPKRRQAEPSLLTEIEFALATGNHRGNGVVYQTKGGAPVVLAQVSPGEYFLRVRHPGTALMPWTKVTVSKKKSILRPELQFGATLVVPYQWPDGRRPERLPIAVATALAMSMIGDDEGYNLLELTRDGQRYRNFEFPTEATRERIANSAVFSELPCGTYQVTVLANKMEAGPYADPYTIRPSSVTATIGPDSPVFVTSEPLPILFTAP